MSDAAHPHPDFPLPAELPLTENTGAEKLDLKTQLVRFIATGVLSAIVDLGLTLILQRIGASHVVAKSVGFVVGTTTAYLINRRWTFQADPSRARFVAVVALYLVTFVVQVGIYAWLAGIWSDSLVSSVVAFVIAQGTATVINFVVQRVVIFRID